MVIVETERLADVPVLHVVKPEKRDARLPLIFFIHGFTSAKEHNLHFGYLLARQAIALCFPTRCFTASGTKV
ncbi:esterase [Geobacillus sp. BCO2]|nr:esterase [Geobacillus sp. BCO2]